MKVSKLLCTNTVAAIANAATVTVNNSHEMKVEWTPGNSVEFRRNRNNRNNVELKTVIEDYSRETVWMGTELKDFDASQQDMIAAAALKLGLTCIMISKEIVSIISTTIYVFEQDKPKAATNWEGAREFGLSQHRREPRQEKPQVTIEVPRPTIRVKATTNSKTALLVGAGILAVGLGLLVAAAASSDN